VQGDPKPTFLSLPLQDTFLTNPPLFRIPSLLAGSDPTMSFVFEWDKLDDEVALQIEGMIHNHFQRIPKPSFMGNIAVSNFRFGSTPPSVTVLDVTDPLEEWYVHMYQEEARLAQEAAEAGGGESMDEDELASGDEYEDDYPYSADSSVDMAGEDDDAEYLGPEHFRDEDQLQTEEWLRQQDRGPRRVGSNSGDSFREDAAGNVGGRRPHSRNSGQTLEQDPFGPTTERRRPIISTSSRSSSSSSASSDDSPSYGQSTSHSSRHQEDDSEAERLSNRNPKLDTDSLPDTNQSTTNSLSSHTSDDEIESEAFYTQGGSTVFQRMRSLVLDPSSPTPRTPASTEGESPHRPSYHPHLGASVFPPSPGTTSGSLNNGLGLGFGGGLGSSPGSVLSTVMQNRTAPRVLSSPSFYGSPTSTAALPPTNAPGQSPQIHFPDLSGMLVSGNSLLGLRAGTPSRTIPSTPRGFESPTLAFSRRQSFSEPTGDDAQTVSVSYRTESPVGELHSKGQESPQPSMYISPVEALSFDAFGLRPKVVERLADVEDATYDHGNDSQSRPSIHGDKQSRSSSIRRHDRSATRSARQGGNTDNRRRRRRSDGREGYGRENVPSPIPYSSSSSPSKRHENDIQLLLSVQYQGPMGFTVETELLLNYPTFAFLALPVKLVITGFSLKGNSLMSRLWRWIV